MYMSALQVAAPEIAMIKVSAPNMALRVLDRAIQVIYYKYTYHIQILKLL